MAIKRRSGSSKNPPIFSHEFVIQNHPDIVSCVATVFVLGLLSQATYPLTSPFVVMSHNVTVTSPDRSVADERESQFVLYTNGLKDIPYIFFYSLICIVVHAVVQEYLLDKLNRRLHLSKIKHSKFNESGQLLVFYLISIVWSVEVIRRERLYSSLTGLWTSYPHLLMPFLYKAFFIFQISYWLHAFPELYLQKVKKDEILSRATYSALYLLIWGLGYAFNFTRIALCLGLIHYTVEGLFHASRLFYFADRSSISELGFKLWNALFVLARLSTTILSVLTFWYGLSMTSIETPIIAEGNFNTPLVRINLLVVIGLVQAWMMWNFINFHLKRLREKAAEANALRKKQAAKMSEKKKKEEDVNELPEVDQNTQKITQRSVRTGKGKH